MKRFALHAALACTSSVQKLLMSAYDSMTPARDWLAIELAEIHFRKRVQKMSDEDIARWG